MNPTLFDTDEMTSAEKELRQAEEELRQAKEELENAKEELRRAEEVPSAIEGPFGESSNTLPDQHISGSGTFGPGAYNEISVSGSARYTGAVSCRSLHVSGSLKGDGSITAAEELHCSGSLKGTGDLAADDLSVSGSLKTDGSVSAGTKAKVSGSISCGELHGGIVKVSGSTSCTTLTGSVVKISGMIRAEKDVEAESVMISGAGYINGLLNAEDIMIGSEESFSLGLFSAGTDTLKIGTIGGSRIRILRQPRKGLFFRQKEADRLCFVTADTIEGDEIELDGVQAECVRGQNVTIHKNCRIGRVEYSGSLTVDSGAEVGEQVKTI